MNRRLIYFKKQLLANIDRALLEPYPDYWLDALAFAKACVQESYPSFNSQSTVDVACSVTGIVRPVRVCALYNGVGVYECLTAHNRRLIPKAIAAETERKKREGSTEAQRKAIRKAINSEVERRKNKGFTEAQYKSIKKAYTASALARKNKSTNKN